MSTLDHVRNQLAAHGAALKGIEAIGGIARDALTAADQTKAATALSVVLKIVEAIFAGFDGKASADDVVKAIDKEIHRTLDGLASHDASHDARLDALDRKFDKGDDNG